MLNRIRFGETVYSQCYENSVMKWHLSLGVRYLGWPRSGSSDRTGQPSPLTDSGVLYYPQI
jgi:hypothetical protein